MGVIFLPIRTGKDLAQFSVGKDINKVEWCYYMDGDDLIERADVNIMHSRMKASMDRADNNTIFITDLIPKYKKNNITLKILTLITSVAMLARILIKRLEDSFDILFDQADMVPKDKEKVVNLILALQDAVPVLEAVKIDPDKKKM